MRGRSEIVLNNLKQIIESSLNELIEKDEYLLVHNVNERAIASKLSCYISNRIIQVAEGVWDVDTEYNRNNERPKSLKFNGVMSNVIPDIIIHRRGSNNDNNIKNNNLLIIEIKKNPSEIEKTNDINKIIAFIKEHPYYYKYGLFISFHNTSYELTWFDSNSELKDRGVEEGGKYEKRI